MDLTVDKLMGMVENLLKNKDIDFISDRKKERIVAENYFEIDFNDKRED